MKFRRSLHFLLSGLVVSTMFSPAVFAEGTDRSIRSIELCKFEEPTERSYDLDLITVRSPLKVENGENTEVKVYFKNDSNVPMFSSDSPCPGMHLYLGTDKERDADSGLYVEGAKGWNSANRVKVDQMMVEPGEIGSFTFEVNVPDDSVYKQYFTPVVEGVTWFEDAGFELNFVSGNPDGEVDELRKKMLYASKSGNVDTTVDLSGPKRVVVDLSDQVMTVMLGDSEIRSFKVSTGGRETPTPVGTHKILGKNDVRIGGAAPHYIMPRFQMLGINGRGFTGYGIHALPSLGSYDLRSRIQALQNQGLPVPHSLYEDDVMWSEAWDHLGTPVSHGCIRVSPDDADFLFAFTEVGETEVVVER